MLTRASSGVRALATGPLLRRAGVAPAAAAVATPAPVTVSRVSRVRLATPAAATARCFSATAAPFAASATSAVAAAEQPITVERRDKGIAIVRFNRPSSLNAMTVQMGMDFQAAMTQLSADSELRVVILTGQDKAFSAGGDLEFLLARCSDAPGNNAPMMRAFYARFLSLLNLPVPIIAAINGPAIGAGMCVAAACDIRIAAKATDMGFTFAKLGLHPGMGCTHFLPAIIGQQNASRLLLTGEIIKGQRALEMGLIGELVEEPSDVLPAALKLAESIASNSQMCIRTLTTSLRMVHQGNMERALWREADAQSQTYATEELKDNVAALKNKSQRSKKADK